MRLAPSGHEVGGKAGEGQAARKPAHQELLSHPFVLRPLGGFHYRGAPLPDPPQPKVQRGQRFVRLRRAGSGSEGWHRGGAE